MSIACSYVEVGGRAVERDRGRGENEGVMGEEESGEGGSLLFLKF